MDSRKRTTTPIAGEPKIVKLDLEGPKDKNAVLSKDVLSAFPQALEKFASLPQMDQTPSEYVKSFALKQLQERMPRDNDMTVDPEAVFDEKLKHRVVMLEAPAQCAKKGGDGDEALGSKLKGLSCQKSRKIDAKALKEASHQYESYLPLHALWCGYVGDILKLDSGNLNEASIQQKLSKADLHGAILSVVRSRCPSLVGAEGILIRETENTFDIVSAANRLLTIPKAHSVFQISVGAVRCTIYGNHFCFRASERAVKKFKAKPTISL